MAITYAYNLVFVCCAGLLPSSVSGCNWWRGCLRCCSHALALQVVVIQQSGSTLEFDPLKAKLGMLSHSFYPSEEIEYVRLHRRLPPGAILFLRYTGVSRSSFATLPKVGALWSGFSAQRTEDSPPFIGLSRVRDSAHVPSVSVGIDWDGYPRKKPGQVVVGSFHARKGLRLSLLNSVRNKFAPSAGPRLCRIRTRVIK